MGRKRHREERPDTAQGGPDPDRAPEGGSDGGWDAGRVALAYAAALTLATILFFASFVFDGSRMLFGTDMLTQAFQMRAFAVQEVQAGRGLPGWNPFVYGGLPFLSALPYPVYYPTSLLYFVMDLPRAIGWTFVFHFVLAGLLAYAMARELGLRAGAAVVTGVAFMFTGYLVSHLHGGQDGRMFALTLAPALILFAERGVRRRSGHWFLWLAGVVALQVFTPHVQMMYFTAMGVGAYVLFRLARLYRELDDWRAPARLLAWFAGAYALAGVITLVEVWPTYEMLQFSHRAARGYEYASSWAMPVSETLGMIWPEFQGYLSSYWGPNPFKLHTEYMGAIPVLLAGLALCANRSPRVWFFTGLTVVALMFSWGAATPVHRIFYWTLPVMKSFRAPSMMFSVVALSVTILAGYGAQALYERREELADWGHVAWKVLGGLGVLWLLVWLWAASGPLDFGRFFARLFYTQIGPSKAAALERAMPAFVQGLGLFAVYWIAGLAVIAVAVRRRIVPLVGCALLAAVTVADTWRIDRDFYQVVPTAGLTRADGAVRFLDGQPRPFRVLPLGRRWGPNELMYHRLEVATGSQPFRLRWYDDLVGEGSPPRRLVSDLRVWRLLDLEYVDAGQRLSAPGLEQVFDGDGRVVYNWTAPTPRAWMVHDVRVRQGGGAPGSAISDPSFDPARTAILEPGTTPPPTGEPGAPATVRWERRSPDELVLSVDAPSAGLLVLSEIYHPYWSATVDGEDARVYRVDIALRGLAIPQGRHRVEMTYSDPRVIQGAWGSGLGLLLWVGLLVWTRRRDAATAADEDPA